MTFCMLFRSARTLAPTVGLLMALGALCCGTESENQSGARTQAPSRTLVTATPDAALMADAATSTPLVPDAAVRTAHGPIILAHGFGGSRATLSTFFKVKEALQADGHFVVVTEVQPFAGIDARARTLAPQVDQALADFCAARQPGVATCVANTRCNIVAHSMGGLDARYLISTLGYGAKVASLTTLSTPHSGSILSDTAIGLLGGDKSVSEAALNALAMAFGVAVTSKDLANDADLRAGAEALTAANAAVFNAANPDDPRVFYASWAGVSRAVGGPRTAAEQRDIRVVCSDLYQGNIAIADTIVPQLLPGAAIIHARDGSPQDGLVTVPSAKHGTFLGCISADHFQEVGQPALGGPDIITGFDHLAFYKRIARDLEARGL